MKAIEINGMVINIDLIAILHQVSISDYPPGSYFFELELVTGHKLRPIWKGSEHETKNAHEMIRRAMLFNETSRLAGVDDKSQSLTK